MLGEEWGAGGKIGCWEVDRVLGGRVLGGRVLGSRQGAGWEMGCWGKIGCWEGVCWGEWDAQGKDAGRVGAGQGTGCWGGGCWDGGVLGGEGVLAGCRVGVLSAPPPSSLPPGIPRPPHPPELPPYYPLSPGAVGQIPHPLGWLVPQ